MAAISGIEAVGAPAHAPTRDQKAERAPVDFGGAVTHRDLVREKLRVDPVALAHKKRAPRAPRPGDPPSNERGQYVDVKA